MPRMAILIRSIGILWIGMASLNGCMSNSTFSSLAGNSVLPADRSASMAPMKSIAADRSLKTAVSTLAPGQVPAVVSPEPVANSSNMSFVSTESKASVPTGPRSTASVPDLGHIYGRTAQSDDRDRNPIIVIPGVLGSRLIDEQTGQVVWGEFGGDSLNPASARGAQLLALRMKSGTPLASLTNRVKPAGTLDTLDVQLFGIPFQINAYHDLLTTLGVGGYRDDQTPQGEIHYADQSYSSFQFAYDWRRDNVENARLLHQFILEKKAYVEAERHERHGKDFEPVRFDIVAHSMGGLIARYYLEYGDADLPQDGTAPTVTWAGAKHVSRLVMIATPNAGSLDALAHLVQGETLSRFLPRYESAILGTMPALYQLLPRTRQRPIVAEGDRRHVDIMDPRVWQQFRWGLMDPRQQIVLRDLLPGISDPNVRQQVAHDHLTKCLNRAQAFHQALDVPAKPPAGTSIHLIAGDAHPTSTQFRVDYRGGLTVTAWQPGDGRVSRPSALMDERYSVGVKWTPRLVSPIAWSNVNFLFADHLGLTRDPGFTDNILFLLLESPR